MIDPTQLDFLLPDGTKLRDATGAQCRNAGEWLLAIAYQLKPHETPCGAYGKLKTESSPN